MILLSDVIDLLVSGDGSQQANFVDVDGGKFNRSKLNSIISIMNAALADIHKRFIVTHEDVIVQTTRDVIDYEIITDNVRDLNNPSGFILNNFYKPVYGINYITDRNGKLLPLNNLTKDYSMFSREFGSSDKYLSAEHNPFTYTLKNYYTVRVPKNLDSSIITLSVRSGHRQLSRVPENQIETFDLTSIEIDLPYPYVNALAYFILHRISNARGGETIGRGIFHEGNNYQQKYVDECNSLKLSNFEVEEISDMNANLHRQGFI
jgi:hypothetical protein